MTKNLLHIKLGKYASTVHEWEIKESNIYTGVLKLKSLHTTFKTCSSYWWGLMTQSNMQLNHQSLTQNLIWIKSEFLLLSITSGSKEITYHIRNATSDATVNLEKQQLS